MLHTARLAGVAIEGHSAALTSKSPAELLAAIIAITWAIEDSGAYFYTQDTAF